MGSGVACVAERKKSQWYFFKLNLEGMLNAAKTNRELSSGFSLFYNARTFAEKFLEALCSKGPKDPNGPLNVANYGLPKYFNYGISGKIGYHEVSKEIGGEIREDFIKFTKNVLKKPEERTPLGHEIKTVEKMAAFFGSLAY